MQLISAVREAILNSVDGGAWLPEGIVEELSSEYGLSIRELMLALIPLASGYAKSDLSGFDVGAVGKGGSGNLYFGANLEFRKGPLSCTLHAEQAVVSNAMMHMENSLEYLAISAAPCGYCRQFLYELECAESLSIILEGQPDALLTDYLPSAFGPNDLGLKGGLLKHGKLDIRLVDDFSDPLVANALKAACYAYVPYTKSASGIALRVKTGDIFAGTYIENAAYNPSILPVQMALSQLLLAGQNPMNIIEVVQVVDDDLKIDHVTPTEMLITSIAPGIKLRIANLIISH